MRFRRAMPLLLTLAAFSLAACGSDDSSSETATTTTSEGAAGTPSEGQSANANAPAASGEAVRSAKVEIADFEYVPATVTIQSGGKVTWLNQDSTEHTATLDDGSFSTGDLAEGKLMSEPFKVPGTYAYHCEIHPEMKGTVEVVEPS